jgi:sugar phosphate isomerase/epimerase
MVRIAIQLYSVHDLDDDTATVLDYVAETDLDGIEFFQRDDANAIREALDRTGLDVAGAHVGLDALEKEFKETVEVWSGLGVEEFVIPWVAPEHFETHDAVEMLADRLSTLESKLEERGYNLHYHNHDQEFVELGDEYALEVLAREAPEIGLEIDLGWAGSAGADPLSLIDQYADRIDLLHVKDYDPETGGPAKVGEGGLDLDAVSTAAEEHEIEWLVYEYEDATDTYDTIDHASEVMPSLKF